MRNRTIRDVHTRTVAAPADTVGALIDRLGGDPDPVFPVPAWPPMRFDRPLGVGADGGHGFVRYRVAAHEPGRRIRFDFTPGPAGFHEVTVHPVGPDSCRVEHVLDRQLHGRRKLLWYAAVGAVHRTVVEELLDNIERAATGHVRHPVRPSPRVRLFRRLAWERPKAVALSVEAQLARSAFSRTDFQDAWQMELPPGMPTDPAAWEGVLRGFPARGRTDRELLLGKDARHLDFRASLLLANGHVTLSTVVHTHHLGGRAYLALIRHLHPAMARLMLRRTHRRLALAVPGAGERERARTGG
ncbi:DUF2867 domain-containing protein [Streptomyces natalensis]|uniref:DUF2867 domain-containing protein n=1 Tax=Streptomyces natalensis ATCC 27448 TaxID=1240678 RepID=A0A0D7CGY6_9ACTN|nr:DUF2867 domain-containing protein [Streptomyces natalensis]KIZ15453.1 hypothetical protein SNA_28315 [Streptomyces natalensis ATCC 27448]